MLSWAPGCSEDRLSPPQLVCGLTSKILAYRSPFPAAGQPQLELPYFANRKAWPWIKTGFSEEPSLRRLPRALGKRGAPAGARPLPVCPAQGQAEPQRPVPSSPPAAARSGSGACVCPGQGEGGGGRWGFCSRALGGSFTCEGNGSGVSMRGEGAMS